MSDQRCTAISAEGVTCIVYGLHVDHIGFQGEERVIWTELLDQPKPLGKSEFKALGHRIRRSRTQKRR